MLVCLRCVALCLVPLPFWAGWCLVLLSCFLCGWFLFLFISLKTSAKKKNKKKFLTSENKSRHYPTQTRRQAARPIPNIFLTCYPPTSMVLLYSSMVLLYSETHEYKVAPNIGKRNCNFLEELCNFVLVFFPMLHST